MLLVVVEFSDVDVLAVLLGSRWGLKSLGTNGLHYDGLRYDELHCETRGQFVFV